MHRIVALLVIAATAHAAELPPQARVRLGSTQFQFGVTIVSAGFTADGKRLFAGTQSGIVVAVDPTTGAETGRFQIAHYNGRQMLFSVEGTIVLALGYDGALRLLDTAKGTPVAEPIAVPHGINNLAWLKADTSFVAAAHGRLHVYNLAGKELNSWAAAVTPDSAVACSPDGKLIAATNASGTIHLWDADGKLLRTFEVFEPATPGSQRGNIAFAGDGKTLVQAFPGPRLPIWNVETGKLAGTLGGEKSPVYAMSVGLTADGVTAVVATTTSRIQVWDLRAAKMVREFDSFELGTSVLVSPDGTGAITCGQGSSLRLWDIPHGRLRFAAAGHRGPLRHIEFVSQSKRLATLGADNVICWWDATTGKEIDRLKPAFPVQTIGRTASDDGVVLADYGFALHTWRSGKDLEPLRVSAPLGGTGRFSPNGRWYAGISNSTLRAFDLKTGAARVLEQTVPSRAFSRLLIAPDSRTLTLIDGGDRQTWTLDDGQRVYLEGREDATTPRGSRHWCISADGRFVALATQNGMVRVVETYSGHDRLTFAAPDKALNAMAMELSADGRFLALAIDRGSIHIYDLATGATSGPFVGHDGRVDVLVFSPDGKYLASGSADTTAILWDFAKLRPARELLKGEPSDADLMAWWHDLSKSASAANPAIWSFSALPPAKTVAFLLARWKNEEGPALRPIDESIRELAHDKFAVRERATRELRAWGEEARSALLKERAKTDSAEARRRIDAILKDLGKDIPAVALRFHRTLEVTTRLPRAAARMLLDELTKHAEPALAAAAKRTRDRDK